MYKMRVAVLKWNELSVVDNCVFWETSDTSKLLKNQVLEELYQSHPGVVQMKSLARSNCW